MKNYVKTNTGLSESDEDICIGIFRGIMRARHLLREKANQVATASDLHAAEMNVIDILGKLGPVSMGRLSRETFISPSNTTSTVKKLEAAALVKRSRSARSDREVTVELTANGRTLFRKCYPKILGETQALLDSRLTRTESRKLASILGKLET